MVNFRFIKSQFKIIWIELTAFFMLLLFFSIMVLMQDSFSGVFGEGGGLGLFGFMFLIPVMFLIPIFIILLVNKLLLKEVNRGYFSSWLMAYMPRKTILNSKFFVIVSSVLILNTSTFLVQLIFFFAKYNEFNAQLALYLFLMFLSLMFISLIFTSIAWIISCYFCSKQALSISVFSGIVLVFVLFYIFGTFLPEANGLQNFKYFKYFTIWSFLKPINVIFSHSGFEEAKSFIVQPFDGKNFAWQLPLMLVLIGGLFVSGNLIFTKKDLHL